MSFAYLLQRNTKTNDKPFSILCEDSNRTIQREINNASFSMMEPDDSRHTAYKRIITLVRVVCFSRVENFE